MGRFNHDQYVELTMHFRCNLGCEHCMIEGTMDRLEPESMERFEELLAYNRQMRAWRALVLTGAEITLRSDLPILATRARENGFEHVRIQTHGMRLADPEAPEPLITDDVMPAAPLARRHGRVAHATIEKPCDRVDPSTYAPFDGMTRLRFVAQNDLSLVGGNQHTDD